MLRRITLDSFKGFDKFTLTLNPSVSVLVGPNNAGKSTIVSVIRLCATLLDHARRRNPGDATAIAYGKPRAYSITDASRDLAAFNNENIYHDFRGQDASTEITFSNGGMMRIEWPESDEPSPEQGFFTLQAPTNYGLRGTALVRAAFPSIGVVPTLTPCEGRERLITGRTVRANYTTRLASSHFRNQLYQVWESSNESWAKLCNFIHERTPEISEFRITRSDDGRDDYLDVYFQETASGRSREIAWAGDGLQVWLQVLFHLWRQWDRECLILDEPDVYLHPDLQRRLVATIRARGGQVVMATHSVEVLNELGSESAIAVNRQLDGAQRFTGGGAMSEFAGHVGSGIQFGLARALTRKCVLFVEGHDTAILRILAQRVGAIRVANEQGLASVPLGGFSGWMKVAGFAKVLRITGGGPQIHVLLDRDHRSDTIIVDIESQIAADGAKPHIWSRKEIENYLLNEESISRISALDVSVIRALMRQIAESLKDEVLASWWGRRRDDTDKRVDSKTVGEGVIAEFNAKWPYAWLDMVPGKSFIRQLNQELTRAGGNAVNAHRLAVELKRTEVPAEVANFLYSVEADLG